MNVFAWNLRFGTRVRLDVLDELGVEIGEPLELRLVQIHHEKLIRWSEIRLFGCELLVEVADVFPVFLK